MARLEVKYIWELPVRATHWINVVCILVLSVTGLFIGAPQTVALKTDQYVMGWVRFAHFTAGYTFAISVAARVYWSFVGNEYARWRVFLPWLTAEGRVKMWEVFSFYSFLSRKVPKEVGLNAMAATAYSLVFLLYLFLIVTGFILYAGAYPHNSVFHVLTGWVTYIVPLQWLRQAHHLTMWLLVGFVINHIYSGWLFDIRTRGKTISGIFSGYKAVRLPE